MSAYILELGKSIIIGVSSHSAKVAPDFWEDANLESLMH